MSCFVTRHGKGRSILVDKIRRFFKRIYEGLGGTSSELTFGRIQRGQVWQRGQQRPPGAGAETRYATGGEPEAVDVTKMLAPVRHYTDEQINDLRRQVLDHAREHFPPAVTVGNNGDRLLLSMTKLKHGVRGANTEKVRIAIALPELIAGATKLDARADRRGRRQIPEYHYYHARAQMGPEVRDIIIHARGHQDGSKRYYDHGLEVEDFEVRGAETRPAGPSREGAEQAGTVSGLQSGLNKSIPQEPDAGQEKDQGPRRYALSDAERDQLRRIRQQQSTEENAKIAREPERLKRTATEIIIVTIAWATSSATARYRVA